MTPQKKTVVTLCGIHQDVNKFIDRIRFTFLKSIKEVWLHTIVQNNKTRQKTIQKTRFEKKKVTFEISMRQIITCLFVFTLTVISNCKAYERKTNLCKRPELFKKLFPTKNWTGKKSAEKIICELMEGDHIIARQGTMHDGSRKISCAHSGVVIFNLKSTKKDDTKKTEFYCYDHEHSYRKFSSPTNENEPRRALRRRIRKDICELGRTTGIFCSERCGNLLRIRGQRLLPYFKRCQ